MKNIRKKYKDCLTDKDFISSACFGFILLFFSLLLYQFSSNYATNRASNAVTDIILSNIPTYNVANIFVYGILIVVIFIIFITLLRPERIPFVVKNVALFVIVRSIFVSLTHIGSYPTFPVNVNVLDKLTSGGDMFFSGHTGLPFLMALIFWKNKVLRYIFIILAVFFGTVALLGHYHYTIDVLAAFFIVFGIYHACLNLFKKDYKLFLKALE